MGKKLLDFLKKKQEIIAYLFWGGMTTVVSWGSYALFSGVCHMGVTVSNGLSWICAVIFAYFTNKLWVFGSKSWEWKVLWREIGLFLSARIITGVFELVMVPLLVVLGMNQKIAGIEGALSKIVVSIAVIILNYICSKLVIFKKQDTTK